MITEQGRANSNLVHVEESEKQNDFDGEPISIDFKAEPNSGFQQQSQSINENIQPEHSSN